jgi:16S rRNA (cytosine967-C5)-methyltransferase
MPGQPTAHHPPAPSLPLARLLELTSDAVQAVRGGRSLTDVLAQSPAASRPAVQALSFHVLRWLGSATELRRLLAAKTPPPAVDSLLLTALALLWPGESVPYAEHTLVDQAVSAARLRVPAAAAFINAVLRRCLRERDALVAAVGHTPLGAYNHPPWWIEQVRRDWPNEWQGVLASANQRPPMTLRVNARRCSGSSYVQRLQQQGRAARLLYPVIPPPAAANKTNAHANVNAHASTRTAGLGQTVVLAEPCPVHQLPGFAEGDVSVQDAAAQLAAPLLLHGLQSAWAHAQRSTTAPGARLPSAPFGPAARVPPRVLDACAAPGGKTAHLLECASLDLLALDSDPTRLARVSDGLRRLQLAAPAAGARVEVRAGDARRPRDWWDGRPFDAILLDAPCTASGIVRRHPDVRWLRRADDVTALVRVQAQLLDALWPLLAPGGCLLYATCSIFKAEGEQQIDAFLQRLGPGAARLDAASPGHLLTNRDNAAPTAPGRSPAGHDGFFYALLHKNQHAASHAPTTGPLPSPAGSGPA